jgi:disulfide bond formation protein DsbB
MMQRVWFILATAVVYVSLLHNPRFGIYPVITILCAIVGGGFSIRQLWLQNLPVSEVPACGPDLAYMLDAFPMSDILIAMTSGTGDCASVAWSFIGISLPGWALVSFIAVSALAFMQLIRAVR